MIRFLKKKIKNSILLVSLMVLMFGMNVYAFPGELDADASGSIKATLKDSVTQEIVTGGEVTLYRLADAVAVQADWSFQYTEAFENCGINMKELPDISLADDFANYAEAEEIVGTVEPVDENGQVQFDDLPLGLYLLVQTTPSTEHKPFSPFFVTVPLLQEDTYVYDVDASPKMELVDHQESTTTPTPTPTPTPGPVPTPTPTPVPTLTPPPVIPQTGQLNWPIPVMIVCGLLFFSFGWYLLRTDEGKKHE